MEKELIRGVVHVLGKGEIICGDLYAGGRGLIGGEIRYDFPEQVKFILKALLLVKSSGLMHIFDLIFQ